MLRRNWTVLAAALLLPFPACSSKAAYAYRTHVPTTPAEATPAGDLAVTGAGYDLQAAGAVAPAALDLAWKGVLSTLNRYVDSAVLTPLRSGAPVGDLGPLFTAAAGPRVATGGADRAAFVDEGLGPATGIRGDRAVATLTALAGTDGALGPVAARLDLRLRAESDGAPVTVARTGELVLVPEGDTWKIDSYDIRVSRESAQATTTTTATSPPPP